MAGSSKPRRMRSRRMWAALAALACWPAFSQTRLSLEALGARGPQPDYLSAHHGESVVVRGVVSARAFHFPDYTLLAIQARDRGGVLRAGKGDLELDAFLPGDDVEAEGVVDEQAGLPVLEAARIARLGRANPPAPIVVPFASLRSFPDNIRYLGRLVRVAGPIDEVSDTTAGGQVLIGTPSELFKLFVPRASGRPDLGGLQRGWLASATGVAAQYCPLPPYDHFFKLLVSDTDFKS